MPELIEPTRAFFGFSEQRDNSPGHPMMAVAVGGEFETMPLLGRAAGDVEAAPVSGWQVVPRVTLCVVQGPGEVGWLIAPILPGQGTDMRTWCEAAERWGHVFVVLLALPELPAVVDTGGYAALPGARGGVVRLL